MLHIGTSGWQYADWRGLLYPVKLPQRRWLSCYADTFSTVEVNSTFYRLPKESTFTEWASEVPAGFTMSVKMSRYLTHVRRLSDPAEPVSRFLARAAGLGDHLGPILIQLPPNLEMNVEALDMTLREFPASVRVVVEPRHHSWWHDDVQELLSRHGAALCWADRRSRLLTPTWRTADFGYVRLHEGTASPPTGYGRSAIDTWLRRLASEFDDGEDVYVYFNNDAGGAAVVNAQQMCRRARSLGIVPRT
ncbi:DUF72 domain-containing protein [Gordonia sp. NPDC003424]